MSSGEANDMVDSRFKFDSPPASPRQKLEADEELVNWITKLGGGLNSSVEIYRDAEKGACLRVRNNEALDASTVVASCPISATMSIINVKNLDPELPPHDFRCSERLSQSVRKAVILAFFVAHQQLKAKDSHWWPYLATLPRAGELTSALFYQGEDLEWLRGTGFYHARQIYHDAVKTEYDAAISILRKEGCPLVESYSWNIFCWAYTVIASRAFTSRVLEAYISKNPALRQDDEFQIMLPLVDSSNHRPLAKIEWRAEATRIGLKVIDPVSAKEEIHNNYGPLNNQQLMATYGFCIVDNPCDFRDLNVTAPPGTPLANARQFRYQEFHEPHGKPLEEKCFLFNVSYPLSRNVCTVEERVFSQDLLDALALTRLTTRESLNIEVTEDRTYANFRHSGSRVVLNALCQGSVELAFRIIKIRRGGYLERQPQNDKQKLAQIYRESEWLLYMTGLVVCEWAITRARTWDPRELETLFQKHLSYIPSLVAREHLGKVITELESTVERPGELFHSNDVLELLDSTDMKVLFGNFIKQMVDCVNEAIDPSTRNLGSNTVVYSIFLLICFGANKMKNGSPRHASGDIFPKRVEEYLNQLIDWYPVVDSQAILDNLEEDVEGEISSIYLAIKEARLKSPHIFTPVEGFVGRSDGWLSEDMLRWAVYVVQEEEVTVLRDPLEMVSREPANEPVRIVTDSYFYVPQLPINN
ncbi:hypothetical protein MferCBS31731_002842 [Microsporum ferrugineum]